MRIRLSSGTFGLVMATVPTPERADLKGCIIQKDGREGSRSGQGLVPPWGGPSPGLGTLGREGGAAAHVSVEGHEMVPEKVRCFRGGGCPPGAETAAVEIGFRDGRVEPRGRLGSGAWVLGPGACGPGERFRCLGPDEGNVRQQGARSFKARGSDTKRVQLYGPVLEGLAARQTVAVRRVLLIEDMVW